MSEPWVRVEWEKPPQTPILEFVAEAMLVHPLRERIGELLRQGAQPKLRLLAPAPELESPEDSGEPRAQVWIGEGDDFISIVTFPVAALLAPPAAGEG